MIQNHQELLVTQERISHFISGGYRAEVERMQHQVLDYLTKPAAQTTAKAG